jgi:hypothetical protein
MNKKENQSFHIEYKYENDIRKENEELFKNISEDKKSEFLFKGEHLYYLGRGHAILRGFFSEYVTQSGVFRVEDVVDMILHSRENRIVSSNH